MQTTKKDEMFPTLPMFILGPNARLSHPHWFMRPRPLPTGGWWKGNEWICSPQKRRSHAKHQQKMDFFLLKLGKRQATGQLWVPVFGALCVSTQAKTAGSSKKGPTLECHHPWAGEEGGPGEGGGGREEGGGGREEGGGGRGGEGRGWQSVRKKELKPPPSPKLPFWCSGFKSTSFNTWIPQTSPPSR